MKELIKKFSNKNPKLYEILKFLIVGGGATIIDMLTMSIVLYAFSPSIYNHNILNTIIGDANPSSIATIIGTGLGFIIGLLFNYFFSIVFVFNNQNTSFAKTKKGFLAFSLLSLVGFIIHTVGMALGYGLLHINEWIIKIVLTFVVLIFNYISRKKIIFK